MEEKKQGAGKPTIDKEYLKKLAEKIKAEKAKKESTVAENEALASQVNAENLPKLPKSPAPPPPSPAMRPHLLDDDDANEGMAAEKTAIIDLASLSGHSADAKLTIIDGKDEGKSIDITREEIFAGRSLDNDFVISDISVSRKHFKVLREGETFKVEDTGSGNGIRVNGKKETSVVLYDGDLITAGARTIKFEFLNQALKDQYTRRSASSASMDDDVVIKPHTPVLVWVALLLIVVVAGGGFYYMSKNQEEQIEKAVMQQQPAVGLEELDKLDIMIYDEKKLAEAEKLIVALRAKIPNSKSLQAKEDLIMKEKPNAANFEKAKNLMNEKNNDEADKLLKNIPEESIFYKDVKSLAGKEKLELWAVQEIEELVKAKKTDAALQKISAALLENPANQKVKDIQSALISQVGAQKVQEVQKEVQKKVEEKKVAEQRDVEVRKKKMEKMQYKPVIPVYKAPEKVQEPAAEPKKAYTVADINEAVDSYVSKDFDKAVEKLEKIAEADNKLIKQKAQVLLNNINKFKDLYNDEPARKSNYKNLIALDNTISKGKLKAELIEFGKEPKKEKEKSGGDEFASEGGGGNGGAGDEEKAKTLYMEALSLKESSPEKAKAKFEEVLKTVPKDNKYYQKAKKALKKL